MTSLSGINLSEAPNSLVYINRSGNLSVDHSRGISGRLVRCMTSLMGIRNYRLRDVMNAYVKVMDPHPVDYVSRSFDSIDRGGYDPYNFEFLSEKLAKKSGLTKDHHRALVLLSASVPLFADEQEVVSRFIREARGSKKLNQALDKFSKNCIFRVVHESAITVMSAYTFKTQKKNLKKFDQVSKKVSIIASRLEKNPNSVFSKKEKLTLREVRNLESLAKMRTIFNRFTDLGLTVDTDLNEKAEVAYQFIEKTVSKAEEACQLNGPMIIAYDLTNEASNRGESVSFLKKLMFNKIFGTYVSHLSIGVKDRGGQVLEAHMWGAPLSKYSIGRRSLGNYCYDTIEFDTEKFVNSEIIEALKANMGLRWKDAIMLAFEEKVQDYLKRTETFKDFYNPIIRRLIAAVGFRFTPFPTKWQDKAAFSHSKTVICSEFVVKALLNCLKELNNELKERLKITDPNIDVVKPPFRSYVRSERLLPHHPINRLLETGFGRKMEKPTIISQILSFA